MSSRSTHSIRCRSTGLAAATSCSDLSPPIEGLDLNGDNDAVDDVTLITDRLTGQALPIGAMATAARAVVRQRRRQFTFPAIAVEGDVLAFLEPEPTQGIQDPPTTQDTNANLRIFDTVLRIYRRSPGVAEELSDGLSLTVDAEPLINGNSVAVSNGQVFFRSSEGSGALQTTILVSHEFGSSVEANGLSPSISEDGRHLAFVSGAANILPLGQDQNGVADVFVRDRDGDGDGAFDEAEDVKVVRVSIRSDGSEGAGGSRVIRRGNSDRLGDSRDLRGDRRSLRT